MLRQLSVDAGAGGAGVLPPSPRVAAPPLWRALAEVRRGRRERAAYAAAVDATAHAPCGDGHPVFVIPGFLSDAGATAPLRAFLSRLGYDVHDWGLGLNLGPRTAGRIGERLASHFVDFAQARGERVTVIGWSLGGIMARQLARHAPERVRQVITLGAPFTGDPRATCASGLYQLLTGQRFTDPDFQEMLRQSRLPPPVPATSIFSKSDGIVAWQCCQEPPAPHSENIEVDSSHGGLLAHPQALLAIAERLAAPRPAHLPDEPSVPWWRALANWFAHRQDGRGFAAA